MTALISNTCPAEKFARVALRSKQNRVVGTLAAAVLPSAFARESNTTYAPAAKASV